MKKHAKPVILVSLAICFAPTSVIVSGILFVVAIASLPKAKKGGAL